MSEDDAFGRANRFLAVRKSTEIARIGDSDIDALLREVEDSTQPKPLEPKPAQAPPVRKPAAAPASNPPPAVSTPPTPSVVVHSQTPGVSAEVLPPASPARGDNTQPINVVVNVQAPVVHPPWWGWWGYPYYRAVCPACLEYARPCGRWRCPY